MKALFVSLLLLPTFLLSDEMPEGEKYRKTQSFIEEKIAQNFCDLYEISQYDNNVEYEKIKARLDLLLEIRAKCF